MRAQTFGRGFISTLCVLLVGALITPGVALAKTAQEIDAGVNAALDRFTSQVKGSKELLQRAKGVLVFAGVLQAGFVYGGEYGEGALRLGGKTSAYYNIASASFGLQLGAQKKDIILVFLEDQALKDFQAKSGWQVGVDASVVLVDVGAQGSIDTTKLNQPIVGFVVGQTGLMYNLSLAGSKISKLEK